MALKQSDVKNFSTLQRAFLNGDACLMECTDKKTGQYVAVICAVNRNDDETVDFVPFGALAEDPYEAFDAPVAGK